jgi:hypothetical protein
MKRIVAIIRKLEQATRPRTPESVAEAVYYAQAHAYVGRHRYVEPEPVLPESDTWRTLKLGWQAYTTPIPVSEVFHG